MKSSCAQWNVPNNSDEEIDHIKNSINQVAGSSSVDPRFILAIIMQESNGCVRVQTTNYGVNNPGLMQSHDGTGTCNDGTNVLNPCPEAQILQMIKDGTEGTAAGDGLKQCIEQEGGVGDVTAYYKAARCYNSGSIAPSGNLGQGIATHCYVSDITNRLLGWSLGASDCNDGTVGSLTSSSWSGSSDSGSSSSPSPAPEPTTILPEPTSTSEPAPVTVTPTVPTQTSIPPAEPTETIVPVPTTTPAATTSAAPVPTPSSTGAPIYPYAVSTCQQYYTVVAGDYCDKIDTEYGISLAQLQAWNQGLDSVCSNLWKGYQYCIKA